MLMKAGKLFSSFTVWVTKWTVVKASKSVIVLVAFPHMIEWKSAIFVI